MADDAKLAVAAMSLQRQAQQLTQAVARVQARRGRGTRGRLRPRSSIAALEGLRDFNLGGFCLDFSATKHAGSSFVERTILGADGKVRH